MKLEVREVKNKEIWESFLLNCEEKTFLDSWNWGEFQKMMENKIWRLGVYNNGGLFSVALVVKTMAKRGAFLLVPHGPTFAKATAGRPKIKYEILKTFLEELEKIAKEEKASFIRISPIWERNEENIEIFKKLRFRMAPIFVHPELVWELDLKPSEEELLMQMRKTARYLIKQGLKNREIEILQSNKIEDVEVFNKLYQETVDRHRFIPFSLNYLKNEFLAFQPDNQISIFFGKYKNDIASSAMIIFWSNIGFYHQGASSSKYPKIPVSYLLQWEAIKEAKRRGCKFYNFWGIAPSEALKHRYTGVTLFKMGFGGYKKEYVKTQDFPISKKYWLTFLFEKLRKTKRGL